MGRNKIKINKSLLENLYLKKGLSPYKIAPKFNCDPVTVSNRLKEHKIPLRTLSQAHTRYKKKDWDGNKIDSAYLLGFSRGDLNAYIPKAKKSETIVVRCHTTQLVQVELIKRLFSKYGGVGVSSSKHGFHVNCFLNNSFSFLLDTGDVVEDWIKNNKKCALSFFAGYIDAEGNFIINQGKARFKLDSYDVNILRCAYEFLCFLGIRAKFRRIAAAGEFFNVKNIFNKDLWRLNINEARSLKLFLEMTIPYLKHKTRLKQARSMLSNINKRIKYGTV